MVYDKRSNEICCLYMAIASTNWSRRREDDVEAMTERCTVNTDDQFEVVSAEMEYPDRFFVLMQLSIHQNRNGLPTCYARLKLYNPVVWKAMKLVC